MVHDDPSVLPPMAWNAWGDPHSAVSLSPTVRNILKQILGIDGSGSVAAQYDEVELTPSALADKHCDGLTAIVGQHYCQTDKRARLLHAGGKSTVDLLQRKSIKQDAVDAVLLPGSEESIAEILAYCSRHRIAVVPFGGGTSVVGGLAPVRDVGGVVALDLRRLNTLRWVDEVSGEAEFDAGVTGPHAEQLLGEYGLSLGHFPQSFQFATIGGFAATRSCGQASAGYGRFDDMIQGLRVITPVGVLECGRAPASAAGPDIRELFAGSEGTLGVITRVRLRVHPIPEVVHYEAWSFPDFTTGVTALRRMTQTGTGVTVVRLSDEVETTVTGAIAKNSAPGATAPPDADAPPPGGVVAITIYEGSAAHVGSRHAETSAMLTSCGGISLGPEPAQAWQQGRFDAPYLRDALLSAGALCETLETATTWSNLSALKTAVTEGLTKAFSDSGSSASTALVMCHISHVYHAGASLYFTVVARQCDNVVKQWRVAKNAASEAIIHHGGTITHHHAVGTDHRQWMNTEVGDIGVQVLRAIKQVVDPAGILNPGKLIP